MKKTIIVLLSLISTSIYAHKQHVHQYITKEGYYLLRNYLGNDIPEMVNHLENSPVGPAWENGTHTTDAWRENIVYLSKFTFINNNSSFFQMVATKDSDKYDSLINKIVEKPDTNLRTAYFYMSLGFADITALCFGYQINPDIAIGFKWAGYWLSGGTFVPNSGTGFGLKISQNIKSNIFNNINYELTLFYRSSDQIPEKSKIIVKGGAIDVNIGNENIKNNGFNFIWLIGVVGNLAQGSRLLIIPNLKIGFNINF